MHYSKQFRTGGCYIAKLRNLPWAWLPPPMLFNPIQSKLRFPLGWIGLDWFRRTGVLEHLSHGSWALLMRTRALFTLAVAISA